MSSNSSQVNYTHPTPSSSSLPPNKQTNKTKKPLFPFRRLPERSAEKKKRMAGDAADELKCVYLTKKKKKGQERSAERR